MRKKLQSLLQNCNLFFQGRVILCFQRQKKGRRAPLKKAAADLLWILYTPTRKNPDARRRDLLSAVFVFVFQFRDKIVYVFAVVCAEAVCVFSRQRNKFRTVCRGNGSRKSRVRARYADFFVLFIFFCSFYHHRYIVCPAIRKSCKKN